MIKLSEDEKKFIEELNHPIYTAEWVEEWINRKDNVLVNAPAALQAMGARGFYEAVRSCMPKYERLKERDRAKRPDLEGDGYDPDGNMVYDTWSCPNCETKYEVDYDDHDFCPKCGQRIDWSEEGEHEN